MGTILPINLYPSSVREKIYRNFTIGTPPIRFILLTFYVDEILNPEAIFYRCDAPFQFEGGI